MPRGAKKQDVYDRFKRHIIFTKKCWTWDSVKNNKGYGAFLWTTGKSILAHRAAFMLFIGSIPDGKHVLHHCDNPSCVNPTHLFLGTNYDNVQDRHKKGRTACGTRKPNTAKLTEAQVVTIKMDPRTQRKIAADYNVTYTAILRIKDGSSWKHVDSPMLPKIPRPKKMFCKRGHPFNEINTGFNKNESRYCKCCFYITSGRHLPQYLEQYVTERTKT